MDIGGSLEIPVRAVQRWDLFPGLEGGGEGMIALLHNLVAVSRVVSLAVEKQSEDELASTR